MLEEISSLVDVTIISSNTLKDVFFFFFTLLSIFTLKFIQMHLDYFHFLYRSFWWCQRERLHCRAVDRWLHHSFWAGEFCLQQLPAGIPPSRTSGLCCKVRLPDHSGVRLVTPVLQVCSVWCFLIFYLFVFYFIIITFFIIPNLECWKYVYLLGN